MEELKFHAQKDHVFSNKSSKAQKDILNQVYVPPVDDEDKYFDRRYL